MSSSKQSVLMFYNARCQLDSLIFWPKSIYLILDLLGVDIEQLLSRKWSSAHAYDHFFWVSISNIRRPAWVIFGLKFTISYLLTTALAGVWNSKLVKFTAPMQIIQIIYSDFKKLTATKPNRAGIEHIWVVAKLRTYKISILNVNEFLHEMVSVFPQTWLICCLSLSFDSFLIALSASVTLWIWKSTALLKTCRSFISMPNFSVFAPATL